MIMIFPPSDFSKSEQDISAIDPETGEVNLGDIVLSAERVISQAESFGHDGPTEYAFLRVHSMLHLCGYDHIEDDDRKLLEERQKIIMDKLSDDFPKLAV